MQVNAALHQFDTMAADRLLALNGEHDAQFAKWSNATLVAGCAGWPVATAWLCTGLDRSAGEPGEFKTERLAAARNVPIRQLTKAIDTLPENKAAPILVYCRSGHRGAVALTVLRMAGYTNVRSIAGGLDAWKAAGLPVAQ
jgi:rhodanese-related sulfurtransferase